MKKEVVSILSVFLLGVFFLGVFIIDNSENRSITGYATYVGEENAIIHAPGEIIVKFKGEVENEEVTQPISEEKIVEGEEIYNLKFDGDVNIKEIIEEYEKLDSVEYAEPNFLMISDLIPNDESYGNLYWPENINAEKAWDLGIGNKEIIIAILDTGVDWNHPDLANNIIVGNDGCNVSLDLDGNSYFGDCRGYDFTDINTTNYVNAGFTLVDGEDYNLTDNDPMDFNSHGTHVAGIAAAVGNNEIGVLGSCYNCSIMPVRTGFSIKTSGGSTVGSLEVDDVAAAIYYAADNNATIISMSFGGGDSSVVRDAVEYAYSKGVILIASSGNAGQESRQYPCAYDQVICVGATNSDHSPASYSNYGDWVDITAPGTSIYSTKFDDSYISYSGTSMSTPLVAGMVGLIGSLFDKNGSEILSALQSTGVDVDYSGTIIKRADLYSAILSLDNLKPSVNLSNPENGHNNLTLIHSFECEISDWQLDNVELKIWNSSGLYYNESLNFTGTNYSANFNVSLDRDSYHWNCLAEDLIGNNNYADENFTISTLITEVSLISPLNGISINSSSNIFSCNAESFSKELNNMTFNMFNNNGLVYSDTVRASGSSNTSSYQFNFTEENDYHWNCESRDSLSELTISENYSISYDITLPVVELGDIDDDSSYESDNQELTLTYEVSESGSCSLKIDGEVDSSEDVVDEGSFTNNFSPGDYIWSVECVDQAGNLGISAERSFNVVAVPVSSGSGSSGSSGSGGSTGGGGGSTGGGEGGASITPPVVNPPVVEEEIVLESEEQVIEENFEANEGSASGITGFAIEDEEGDLSTWQKYKNRVNIFVLLLLVAIGFLFYRDINYEKEINDEIQLLEK